MLQHRRMFPHTLEEEKKQAATMSYSAGYDTMGALRWGTGRVTQLNRMWRTSCSATAEKMWLFKTTRGRSGTGQGSSVEA